MVKVDEVSFAFGQQKAVDRVSFNVGPGEVFGLLGPNGAGKTTTFLLLSGVLPPQTGKVTVCGRDPRAAETRSFFGHAPQAVSLYDLLSAEENLRFLGRLYGLEGKNLQARIEFCFDLAGLLPRRQQPVASFSGGMKRRLNVAASILHDPPVVLLDEPTAGVDPQSRANLFAAVRHLKAQGKAVVFASHVLGEAEQLCDRVAILDHGRIVAEGSVDHLLRTYGGHPTITGEVAQGSPRPQVQGVEWTGLAFRMRAPDVASALQQLSDAGVQFAHLELRSPSLEDVFLHLTGREVRDS